MLFCLRQKDTCYPRRPRESQIVAVPFGGVCIDPQQDRFFRGQPFSNGQSGFPLPGRRNRVFQIHDHRVGTGSAGLVEAVRTVARNEEIGSRDEFLRYF